MRRFTLLSILLITFGFLSCSNHPNNNKSEVMEKTLYDFTVKNKKGEDISLSQYKGKVVLVVNTASKCGFTPQFKGLESLWEKYKDQGLVIAGFPCNQFAGQDPGTNDEIQEFCSLNYGVTFPMYAKIEVNGENEDPLFTWLKSQAGFAGWDKGHELSELLDGMLRKQDPDYDKKSDIKWNFTKFLIGKDGKVVRRFEPTATPEAMDEYIANEL